jgi:hypothetical protein
VLDSTAVSPDFITSHASQFDTAVFQQKLTNFIDQHLPRG